MKNIHVIGVPLKLGCSIDGADLSYKYLKNSIKDIIKPKYTSEINVDCQNIETIVCEKMKNVSQVMEINRRLYNEVYSSLNNSFPLIIGGDHSLAIGSISAVLDYYCGDVSVIYLDKHTDIHTEATSPSGNMHGIPLSSCIGRCNKILELGNYRLNTKNLFFLGICNYEKEEIDYINKTKIFNLKDNEINENNISQIVADLKKKIKTKHIHLSFDLDCIRDIDFHAVNVSANNTYQDNKGLSFAIVKKLLEELLKNLNLCSVDLVEYNPLLDKDSTCLKKIEELFEIIINN